MSIAFIVLRLVRFWRETGAARVTSLDELRLAHNRSSFRAVRPRPDLLCVIGAADRRCCDPLVRLKLARLKF